MNEKKRKEIVKLLVKAYGMELETVSNYLANSIHLDGIRAKHVKDSLAADVTEELGHAQLVANRIKILEGRVPGSLDLDRDQKSLQPPKDPLDVMSVVKGVIEAEQAAVDHYQKLIETTEVVDPVTQDLCIKIKGDEEEHRRLFKGYLAEMKA